VLSRDHPILHQAVFFCQEGEVGFGKSGQPSNALFAQCATQMRRHAYIGFLFIHSFFFFFFALPHRKLAVYHLLFVSFGRTG
jgi:hypothetical protein